MDQRTEFKRDILDLLSRKRGGHVERWLYTDVAHNGVTGSGLWSAFLRAAQNYYVLPNEIKLIRRTAALISPRLDRFDTVVDLGVGDKKAVKKKARPVIDAARNSELYVPVDQSEHYLQGAESEVKEHTGLEVKPVRGDFFRDPLVLPGRNRLSIFFGATISNLNALEGEPFPRASIVQKLSHIRGLLDNGHENLLLASFDSNADPQSIMQAYEDIHWKRFVSNLAYSMEKLLHVEGNFRPSAWHHEAVWDDNAKVLHHMLVASEDQDFSIDGIPFQIKKGERFVAINCFKFPIEWFHDMARDAGFDVKVPFIDSQNRMVVQPMGVNI